jgi:hypothetical protein
MHLLFAPRYETAHDADVTRPARASCRRFEGYGSTVPGQRFQALLDVSGSELLELDSVPVGLPQARRIPVSEGVAFSLVLPGSPLGLSLTFRIWEGQRSTRDQVAAGRARKDLIQRGHAVD